MLYIFCCFYFFFFIIPCFFVYKKYLHPFQFFVFFLKPWIKSDYRYIMFSSFQLHLLDSHFHCDLRQALVLLLLRSDIVVLLAADEASGESKRKQFKIHELSWLLHWNSLFQVWDEAEWKFWFIKSLVFFFVRIYETIGTH